MEKLSFRFPATQTLESNAHVGVVGSGDLEILMEPSEQGYADVTVRTGTTGFNQIWKTVLERFFSNNDVSAIIKINDFGATPGVVSLRLSQALEVGRNAGYAKK
ncbi:malonate decarboxylase subunit delta [Cytobacillus oceanisediminis]|uniref:Malonate decarboxylase acyl carrier protein n=1 Tax=Cytobacillus oceanisediminis TaxID=665099 RepID=A0A562K7P6_9BACI|nr:malonate decarboxylase subunit delta [Cytobacillus oceanisediminis]TWH91263.1 malonate decarboxylase delta subunit [Cytobacillus oceanisediminis]